MAEHPKRVVVVGGGLAAAKTVEALRDQGYEGSLDLVTEESDLPYERPPLSKEYLHGRADFDASIVHDEAWYAEHDITLHRGIAAMNVDAERHEVTLADDTVLRYDKLVLATGAAPRKLDVPGAAAALYLRGRHDSDVLREAFTENAKVVIIGAGWIGLETAAAARAAGAEVTVLEAAALPLLAALGPEMAEVYAQVHRDHGVDLRLKTNVTEVVVDEDDGRVTGVRIQDGEDTTKIPADVVVVGVGVTPEDSLARLAGLKVDNGVLVDSALHTSDRDIYAVGDVANHDHPHFGRLRVEHWANALNQPAVAAASILGRSDASYDRLPYFYSDQYDVGMEYVGYARPDSVDRVVVRGDTATRKFVAFWLDAEQHILAAMNVNVWDVPDAVRPLIVDQVVVDPDRLADPSVGLEDVAVSDRDDDDAEESRNGPTPDDDAPEDGDGTPDGTDAAAPQSGGGGATAVTAEKD